MAWRLISKDVKQAAIRLYDRRLLALEDILDCLNMSRSTFFRILKLWRETGDVVKQARRYGRPRALHYEDVHYLIRLVCHRPDWFLDELLGLLERNRFISVHYTTIHRTLERSNISLKKLRIIAKERNEELRTDFKRRMGQYDAEQLGFMDEVSKDERTTQRRYGRSLTGTSASKKGVFIRGRRVSAEGLLTIDGMVASTVVTGSMTRERFLDFLEKGVMPLTTPFPGTLSVLVMDNAKIHHGEQIMALANRFGVRVEYLPPYSPDLNPIEEAFSKVKHWIRRNGDLFRNSNSIIYDMLIAMDVITDIDAIGYIQHAGYHGA